ncbi:YoaK family protein [Lacticaseibacillus suihuaensis]
MVRPMHFESTTFGALLTASAGGLNAYSYLEHGGVFAGLQTGNLIMLGARAGQHDWVRLPRYLIALAAFATGTLIIRLLQRHPELTTRRGGRRRLVLAYVLALLLVVCVIGPVIGDTLAVVGLSLAAAALLQEFRQLNGAPFTPLMMTGNVRVLAESALDGWVFGDAAARILARRTAALMASFALGAAGVAALVAVDARLALGLPALFILIAGVAEDGQPRPAVA